MITNELKRLEILTKVKDKHLRQPKGAKELGISPRQLRRLLRRFKAEEPKCTLLVYIDAGLAHQMCSV